ncbi:MAG: HPr family phosphocarrier protein [Planctomycetota bacterium]|jgi:phosphocarrier protein
MEVEVVNPQGLHMRPCHMIVSTAMDFSADLKIHFDGREVNGKSILDLISLNAPLGSKLSLSADGGDDADGLLDAIRGLFAAGFGELDG